MYLDPMEEVRRSARVARNYLTIAIVGCIAEVLLLLGIFAVSSQSEDTAGLLLIWGICLLPLVIILIAIIVAVMSSLLKVEREQSLGRAYVMLEKARSNTLVALIFSLLLFRVIPTIFLGLAYLAVKNAKGYAMGTPPGTRPHYGATPYAPPPSQGTSPGLNEDVPPPGVDYWEWKEKHGYWARKRRGEL